MPRDVYLYLFQNILLPSAIAFRGMDYISQQENDSKHTADKVKYIFNTLYDFGRPLVAARYWPSRSPVLNPIEHL